MYFFPALGAQYARTHQTHPRAHTNVHSLSTREDGVKNLGSHGDNTDFADKTG